MAGRHDEPVARDEVERKSMRGARPVGSTGLALLIAVPLILGIIGGGVWGYMLQRPAESGAPSGQTVTIQLKAEAMAFWGIGGSIDGKENPSLAVGLNDHVTITVVNADSQAHNLYVEGYDALSANFGPGQTGSVHFVASQEGTFAYYCAIPGHREMGMEGTLVVGSGQGGTGGLPPIGPEMFPLDTAYISREASDVPPPTNRTTPATVDIYMEAIEVNAEIELGVSFQYWTYNGTVPGPMFRVRVNDTVVVHFKNAASSMMPHSVDFHAATGPGGGMAASMSNPGEEHNFSFKALIPGLYVYHCGTPNVPTHVSMGMYGMILVEPDQGLPYFDGAGKRIKEFYVVQGELYMLWPVHTQGNQLFDGAKLTDETPTYVVFNGRWQALTGDHSLHAAVNDTVRIYFGVGGPNLISSFHIIGEMFDLVWAYGDLIDPPLHGVQTVPVVPGGAVVVQLGLQYPANYILVDHALTRAIDKGAVGILNVTGPEDATIFSPLP